MLKEILTDITEKEKLPKSFTDICKKAIDVLTDLRNENDEEEVIKRYDERIKEFKNSLKTGMISAGQLDFICRSGFCK